MSETNTNKSILDSLYHPRFYFFDPIYDGILYDLADWLNGGAFKQKDYINSGIPIIKIAEIKNGLSRQTKFTERKGNDKYLIKKKDLLFSWSGQPETSIDIFRCNFVEGILNQHIFKIIPNDKIRGGYLFYLLKYIKPNFISIAKNKQTTGLGHVTKEDLKRLHVKIPSHQVQYKIEHYLNIIDKKIELNQKISRTLEEIAQTLFKSWFVDFDPVHAKKLAFEKGLTKRQSERAAMAIISGVCSPKDFAENFKEMDKKLSQKLSKMNKEKQEELAHTASLFPSELEDSELGKIPKGFSVKTISDISDVIGGGTPPTNVEEYYCKKETGISWLSPKDLSGYNWKFIENGATDITDLGLKKSSARLIPSGTVVISSRAPIGYVAIAENELSTNQGFKSLVPNKYIGVNFLYNWAKSSIHAMEAVATGSTFKEISGTNMKNLKVVVPQVELISIFEKKLSPLSELQKYLRYETENLEKIRDTLLPKLLAGKIDLSKIQLEAQK